MGNLRLPRLQRGKCFVVIEPTGDRFFLRWQGRIEQEIRWDPETVTGGSEWRRRIVYPKIEYNLVNHHWFYTFTRRGIERKLRRWFERQAAEQKRKSQREEYPA